ncbi:uncharacterized protein [Musca autumnalis]|uniref:uncharacterized protein n=1 Tax=Musca autumnalis TaxID=221902 RepID=UPI003CF9F721
MKPSINFGGTTTSNRPSTSQINRFSVLSELNDMETNEESQLASEDNEPKPPPLIADKAIPLNEIQHILGKTVNINAIQLGQKSSHPRLKNISMDPQNIIDDLKSYNLSPTNVIEVPTKFSSAHDAVYKVQFLRKQFSPNHLKEVDLIRDVYVTWKKQRPKKGDRPTQCWNCLMFGHGGEHCFRQPACMICANNHHTEKCPIKINDKKPAVFSCFNCKNFGKERTDHSANVINCPMRAQYLEIRSRATNKNQERNVVNHSTVNIVRESSNHTRAYQQAHHTRDIPQAGPSNSNNSNNELFDIFTNAIDELSQCKTKSEQMHVIMSLLKHAYGFK